MSTSPAGWGPPPPTYGGPPQTDTKAVIALVLAVAAWTPTVPFLGAIGALILSRMARRDIEASGGARTGLGLCRAANVIAVVHLVVLALAAVILLALVVLPFTF